LKTFNALCVCLQYKHPRSMKRVIRSDKRVTLLLLLWSHKCDHGAEPRSHIIATSTVKGLNTVDVQALHAHFLHEILQYTGKSNIYTYTFYNQVCKSSDTSVDTHTHTVTHTHTHTHTNTHTYTNTHTHIYKHTHSHIQNHTCTCAQVYSSAMSFLRNCGTV
jgi:hypothetical protein